MTAPTPDTITLTRARVSRFRQRVERAPRRAHAAPTEEDGVRGNPPCPHLNFEADVQVDRIEDRGAFFVDVQVRCAECKVRFAFLGVERGLDYAKPMVSVDLFELRAPIAPDAHTTTLMAGADTGFPVREERDDA